MSRLLSTIAVAAVVVSGCQTGSGDSPEEEAGWDVPSRGDFDSLRDLEGTISITTEGAVPVEGAPSTVRQQAWSRVFEAYEELQPNVEVEVEDLPAGQVADEFCRSRQDAAAMPDITFLQNCEGFRPSPVEIEEGTAIATDFKEFEDETNPYTGEPWKDDWLSDSARLARCHENGAVDSWTCMTDVLELKMILVNWDILEQFGVTSFPETLTELWELSDEINASGDYVAWDNHANRYANFRNNVASLLTMDVYEAGGGDPDNLAVNPFGGAASPQQVENWCDGTFWLQNNPSMQEAIHQSERFVLANGDPAEFFDPTREQARRWLTGQAAFWWMSSVEDQPLMTQAEQDGTLMVEDWGLEYLPDFTADELIDPSIDISFDGKFMVESGGLGDTFAPLPHVRESGEDENVDLIVRDFLQFMSSPYGQQRIIDQGLIPVNPNVFTDASPEWVEAIETYVPESAELYQNATQPPGSFMNRLKNWDSESTEEAYLRGDLTFEEFMSMADENVTREGVARLANDLEQWGLTELPPACEQWN